MENLKHKPIPLNPDVAAVIAGFDIHISFNKEPFRSMKSFVFFCFFFDFTGGNKYSDGFLKILKGASYAGREGKLLVID